MINKNNPFNIRYNAANRWIGLTGNHKGFCEFSELMYGIRAAAYIIMVSYRRRSIFTYKQIISAYAPSSENNTEAYLSFICKTLQVKPDDNPRNIYDIARLLVRIAYYESSFVLDRDYTIFVINHFKLKFYEKESFDS